MSEAEDALQEAFVGIQNLRRSGSSQPLGHG